MRLITLAIHTYDHALELKQTLEAEGINVTLQNVNLERPEVASGVRVRISEKDLPLALRIVENPDMFIHENASTTLSTGRSVLVPIDFTEHSLAAVDVAVRLAQMKKVDIHFLHSYIDPRLSGAGALTDRLTFDYPDSAEGSEHAMQARELMKKFADNLREKMKRGEIPVTRFSTQIIEGVPEDAINSYSKSHIPYLIVMGTRTSAQKDADMIGSVTASIFDSSRYPVLSIPANTDFSTFANPSNILFFSNLDQEDIIAIDTLYRLFPNSSAKVTIAHIPGRSSFTDFFTTKSAMALSDYCSKAFSHFSFRTIPLSRANAAERIREEQNKENFDLVVVTNRRKNAFARLFNPGVAYKLAFSADIPTLLIPV